MQGKLIEWQTMREMRDNPDQKAKHLYHCSAVDHRRLRLRAPPPPIAFAWRHFMWNRVHA